ncbi:MAG: hypothetical protein RIQ89_2130 [Bacteroidota bacterium]|jgi:L-threonylcarbamoyladenylate synthase
MQNSIPHLPTIIGTNTATAAHWLQQGELVALPTETVYGLAANALDHHAVLKIFEAKQRPLFNPLIIHLHHPDQLPEYVTHVPPVIKTLIQHFSPGPLTYLLPKSPLISDLITAGSPLVAIRFPAHPLTTAVLQQLTFPLAAPSANKFTYISPTTAQHVHKQLNGVIPYILDGGPCSFGIESTIISAHQHTITIHRQGSITAAQLQPYCNALQLAHQPSTPNTPGQLLHHYSPRTPFVLTTNIQNSVNQLANKKIGLLLFQTLPPTLQHLPHIILSPHGHLYQAAQQMYAAMHTLDDQNLDIILAEKLPNHDIGAAINDRLQRASHASS